MAKKPANKYISPAIVSVFALFLIAMSLFFINQVLPPQGDALPALSESAGSAPLPTGHMEVTVVDGLSGEAVEGATVVIPEAEISAVTDAQGRTGKLELPIIPDGQYAKIMPQPWGEVTLLVYREGYIPYAVFHAQVWESQHRDGPKVYLFKQDDTPSDQPFSIVEGPQRLWVNELLNQYKPK